jgi:hypothetical protein
MAGKRVLMIGLDPEVMDFSSPLLARSGATPDSIRAALAAELERLRGLGYEPELLPTDGAETAERVVRERLAAERFDVVVIGAGIRLLPEYFLLFERLINAVREAAPGAPIALNSRPGDTAEAVARWL